MMSMSIEEEQTKVSLRTLIVPHAEYVSSGPVAASALHRNPCAPTSPRFFDLGAFCNPDLPRSTTVDLPLPDSSISLMTFPN
jgi:hypothetical protein